MAGVVPFRWRLDWFPVGHYVRFCMTTKYVDTGDIFGVACASSAAAKVANSAYLGRQKLETTAAANGFNPAVLRYVRWRGTRSDRKMLPVGAMKSIVGNMTTATAKHLLPELDRLVDDLDNGRMVPELVEDTAVRPLGQLSSVSDAEVGTLAVSGSTMIVPNTPLPDAPYSSIDIQLSQWKACSEVSDLAREECSKRNKFMCEQAIAILEHNTKKQKIAQQSEYDSHILKATAEHEIYKLKLKQVAELQTIAANIGAVDHKAALDKLSDDFWEKVKNNLIENTVIGDR
jgi:uncharacterized protein YihD (DUF1040 family)